MKKLCQIYSNEKRKSGCIKKGFLESWFCTPYMVYKMKYYWFPTLDTKMHLPHLCSTCLTGSGKLTVSMVSSTLRTLPKKSVIRTLPGLLRKRSVRWPGVDTHWLLGHTLNCEHTKQANTMTNLFTGTEASMEQKHNKCKAQGVLTLFLLASDL